MLLFYHKRTHDSTKIRIWFSISVKCPSFCPAWRDKKMTLWTRF